MTDHAVAVVSIVQLMLGEDNDMGGRCADLTLLNLGYLWAINDEPEFIPNFTVYSAGNVACLAAVR